MSTATPTKLPADYEPAVVLNDVSWDEYVAILAGRGDHRFHHTYDSGVLEIMSPSRTHEWEKKFLARIIEQLADVVEIDICCLGSSTHNREDLEKGLEPDECYYIANEPVIRGHAKDIDLTVDPPPDLVVEIDVTSSSIPRQPIYAALGVPELWRFDGKKISILQLDKHGTYIQSAKSVAFPFLPATKLTELLTEESTESDSKRMRRFIAWARDQVGKSN